MFNPVSLFLRTVLASVASIAFCVSAHAQPSGGPYGPIQLNYELPEVEGMVYFVSPGGDADASGDSVDVPTTIESAISRVVTGDAIVLRGGVYRTGDLMLNQGITMQPYQDEQPVLKGTKVAEDWEELRDNLWRIKWEHFFPLKPQGWWRREREARRTPMYLFNNDMLFVDGEMYRMVGWPGEIEGNDFYIDYEEGYVYIGTDPTDRLVEITAYDNAMTRVIEEVHGKESDGLGPKVLGIVFTQYAYRAIEIDGKDPDGVSPESEHGNDVVGSHFENCTFRYCSRVGGYFRGNDLVIRNCLVSNTSTEGIFVLASNDALLERNIVTRNNMEGITGYYNSAIKIFNQCYRVVCRDNLIIDNPGSSGIWYDVGNVDGLFVNNWIQSTTNGFFFEISKGAICAGNVFVDCHTGIRVLNSERVRVYQNTLVNSMAYFQRTERSAVGDHFGWHPRTGPKVEERDGHVFVGNLLFGDSDFDEPLLKVEQSEAVRDRLKDPQFDALDYNVYVRRGYGDEGYLLTWSPSVEEENIMTLDTPAEITELNSDYEANSEWYLDYNGPVFYGEHLGRFDLLSAFPASGFEADLPQEAIEALGWEESDASYPGAFPVKD